MFSVGSSIIIFPVVLFNKIICVVVCLSMLIFCLFLNGVTKLQKMWNYKQGWGYSKLRCSPKYLQPKDADILCLVLFSV